MASSVKKKRSFDDQEKRPSLLSQIMELEKLRKSSAGRSKFSFPSFPRLSRHSSAGDARIGPRGRRQAFGAVHFKKEKTFKQLVVAIEKRDTERIEELLAGIEYGELDDTGALLLKAVRQDSLDIVTILLNHGAPVISSLCHGNHQNGAVGGTEGSGSAGATPSTSGAGGTMVGAGDASALHIACRHGAVAMATLLLGRTGTGSGAGGTSGGAPAPGGGTSASPSAGASSIEAVVGARTRYERRTPLHHAALAGSDDVARMLVGAGAECDARDIYGTTPLHLASQACHVEVVSLLIDSGANVQLYDKEGWTSLHLAAEAGHCVIASLLLGANANIDAQTKFGRTALHWACMRGQQQMVRLLLGDGASVDIKDLHDKTPDRYLKDQPELQYLMRKARKPIVAADTIGQFVEIAVERDVIQDKKQRERKKADLLSVVPTSVSGSLMSVILEEEPDTVLGDDVDDGFVSQLDTSSPQLSAETEIAAPQNPSPSERNPSWNSDRSSDHRKNSDRAPDLDPDLDPAPIRHRESCVVCETLNLSPPDQRSSSGSGTRKRHTTCQLHRLRDTSEDLQRVRNRIHLNFAAFSSDVDHIARQVQRAMDSGRGGGGGGGGDGSNGGGGANGGGTNGTGAGDTGGPVNGRIPLTKSISSCSALLIDAFPALRTLRSKLEAFESDLASDLRQSVIELEELVGDLHAQQSSTELRVPRTVKLISRFCQAVATTLSSTNSSNWTHLLKALPIEKAARDKIKQKVRRHDYASECANVHEVLLLYLQQRGGDMTLFIKTVLDAIDLDEAIAKYKDDIVAHLVTCLAGKHARCPSKATITAVAESLSESALAAIAREVGLTPDKLLTIKRLSEAGGGETSEAGEILSAFLHAADDLPILDKMRILTDALVFVSREDLLVVLFEQ